MAQYNLAAGTKFTPFSYERYLQPLAVYNQALQSLEDLASELSSQANAVRAMANKQTDAKAYKQYENYANDLLALSDLIASKGLYEGSRKAMMDLKNRYNSEITPIVNAYNTKKKQMELQQTMRNQHPDMMYGRDASTTSLDVYLDNPNYDATSQVYSGEMLKKTVADAAGALAKEAHANPNIKKTLQQILPYQYYAELERTGFKSEDVYKAIHSADGSPILRGIVNDAIKGAGIDKWDNADTMVQRAYDYASPALYHAVGTTKFGPLTDQAGLAELNFLHQMRLQKQAQEAAAAAAAGYQNDFPVDTQEVTFGADSSDALTTYNNMKAILGISGGNGGTKVGYHDIQVGNSSGYASKATNVNGSKNFKVTDKKGYILSREAFMSQGRSAADKKALANYYDNKIMPAIESVGAKGSRHLSNIYKKGYSFLLKGGATYLTLPRLQFSDNNKVFNEKFASIIDNNSGAYELTGSPKDYSKGKRVKSEDIRSNIPTDGSITFHPSFSHGTEGMIISAGDHRYFVPMANLPSAARNAFKKQGDVTRATESLKLKIKGNRAFYDSKYGKDVVDKVLASADRSVQVATGEALRDIGWSTAGEYSDPSAKLFQQPSLNL